MMHLCRHVVLSYLFKHPSLFNLPAFPYYNLSLHLYYTSTVYYFFGHYMSISLPLIISTIRILCSIMSFFLVVL